MTTKKTKALKVSTQNGNPRVYFPRNWKAGDMVDYIRKLHLNQLPEEERAAQIKKWKQHLPDGARVLGRLGFQKKQLDDKSVEYFGAFLMETCRAELTHWILILFAPFFFLWNPQWVGFFMIFYALLENAPFIIAQRYNRYRFRRLLEQNKLKS